ncbi:MAG TPA: IS110 family transposase [Terriglobia bacterium]|nr:IS110 family transposase [Terriglobia bacterium]
MKKHSKNSQKVERKKQWKERPAMVVGLDLGDRHSHYWMLNVEGDMVEEGKIPSTEKALSKHFEGQPRQRIAMECGTHSPWVSRLLERWGHQVIVANARQIPALTASESRNDRNDAEKLAELAYSDPELLKPIQHRSVERQRDLNLIQVRDTLVRARTMIINSVRGLVKSAGGRLPKCEASAFATQVKTEIPAELKEAATPLLEQTQMLTVQILSLEKQIEKLAEKYPEIVTLRTVPGVGPLIASAYVLTLDRPEVFSNSRQAGAFLGLRPRQKDSGNSHPQCRISKNGNRYLRRLLVQGAHYVLGRFGKDSALRRWGLQLATSGGKRGKKRAVVAVARKLAVLLHRLWKTGENYQAFPESDTVRLSA